MNGRAISTATAYVRDNWHLITDDETKFKLEFFEQAKPSLAEAEASDISWHGFLKKHRQMFSHMLGWRVADHFLILARDFPDEVGSALRHVHVPVDADPFWERLQRMIRREGRHEDFDKMRSTGARASVASFFLFLRDPIRFPVFRPGNYGRPLTRLMAEPLANNSPGQLLSSYYDGIERLRAQFESAGLPAMSPLDVQGILWVVNYKKVLESDEAA